MKRFGEKLRFLRQQRNLSLMELGGSVDIHYTHLGKIEIGKKRPSADLILRIADFFNLSADQLMRDELEL